MHGPAETECEACHVQGNPQEHTFFLAADEEELCQKCHLLPRRRHMHDPVTTGACMDCHDPHGSSHPSTLIADPQRDLCASCHAADIPAGEFVHGPVVVGACLVCHEPHASAEPALLRLNERETCRTCHPDLDRVDQPGMHRHDALDEGCSGCHDPHASDFQYQLHAGAPDLCMDCHQEQVEATLAGAAVVHGAVLEPGGCSVCHEPHASELPNLQRAAQPEMCLGCHDTEMRTEDGEVIADMVSLLERNPNHHGPIREGLCTECHKAHAAENFRLLVEDYPPEFYAPFDIESFSLCFRCHIPDLALDPAGRGLTRFRDGDENLHYLHVNQEKGRTCRACHEVHASSRPAHVRDAVPFGSGGWMLEINFEQTSQGGVCTPACHQTRTYTHGNDARIPDPRTVEPGASR